MAKIAIIIVTYNSECHIYECLNSIFRNNDIGKELEVIVVDNCSKEFIQMRDKIEKIYHDRVNVISNTTNGGYGQGNNIGIRFSSAPVIMIMNPDVRLVNPIFEEVSNIFELQKDVVQLGLQQIIPGRKHGYSFSLLNSLHPLIALPLIRITKHIDVYIPKLMYFAGSCFFIRKSTFEKIGLFDEDVFMYHEEEDVHHRLRAVQPNKMIYFRGGRYEHLHDSRRLIDDKFLVFITSFNSLKTFYSKYGWGISFAYKREYQKYRLLSLKEKFLLLIGKGDLDYYRYLNDWCNKVKNQEV